MKKPLKLIALLAYVLCVGFANGCASDGVGPEPTNNGNEQTGEKYPENI